MSIKYEADFPLCVLAGATSAGNITRRSSEKNMCHKFSLKPMSGVTESSTVKLLPGKIYEQEWLFGPATTLDKRSIIYPCARYRCSVPCPCQLCYQPHIPLAKELPREVCTSENFKNHSQFHQAFHPKCQYCLQLVEIFPNFNFWFLNSGKRVVMYLGASWENFDVKSLVVNTEPPAWAQNPNCASYYLDLEGYEERKNPWTDYGWTTCGECNYWVSSNVQLKEHIELNHLVSKRFFHCYPKVKSQKKNKGFNCDQCEARYDSRRDLKRHALTEHFEKTFECNNCSDIFTREDNLERHIKVVHRLKETKVICPECDNEFLRKDYLDRHIKEVHWLKELKFACPECENEFLRKDTLDRHTEEAHGLNESKFTCPECGKQFLRKTKLLRHQSLLHEKLNAEAFSCENCNTSFSLKSHLDRHIKSSVKTDGTHKYECDECAKYFCTGKLLVSHHNLQHMKLSCDDCGLKFSVKKTLEHHIKNKTNVPCSECDANLCNSRSLSHHMTYVHKYEKCIVCEGFYLKESLQNHKLMAHEHKR